MADTTTTTTTITTTTAIAMEAPPPPKGDRTRSLPPNLDCNPCIRRSDFVLKAIVHGTLDDPYWQVVEAAMQQAAVDLNVGLEMQLYEHYEPNEMANDIKDLLETDERIDALIVTIPSPEVANAITRIVQASTIPVFGFNTGYAVYKALGVLGFVAQDEYQAGVKAAEEFLNRWYSEQELELSAESSSDDNDPGKAGALTLIDIIETNNNNDGELSAGGGEKTPSQSKPVEVPDSRTFLNIIDNKETPRGDIQRALFVNHQKGIVSLEERYKGFRQKFEDRDVKRAIEAAAADSEEEEEGSDEKPTPVTVEELVVHLDHDNHNNSLASMNATIYKAMEGCPYNIILAGGILTAPILIEAATRYKCYDSPSNTMVATFDQFQSLQLDILQGRLEFALLQQKYLQGALPIIMAATYATTGTALVNPINYRTYLSGPLTIDKNNIPPDSLTKCEEEAFPICGSSVRIRQSSNSATTEKDKDNNSNLQNTDQNTETCDCFERDQIRIGGVLHGHTADKFWDPIYLAAENAALDMNVQLELNRLAPEDDSEILYEKMASQIRNLCQSGTIDGIFVTIPDHEGIRDAIGVCQLLNIPIVAVNSNPEMSEKVGVTTHIGQDEHGAGYVAAQEMMDAGMIDGYCLSQQGNSGVQARCKGFVDAISEKRQQLIEEGNSLYADLLNATIVDAPIDLDSRFKLTFEEAVGPKDGNEEWAGVGWLIGARHLEPTLGVQESHPSLVIGMFDVGSYGDIIFKALDEGKLLFTSDQQPFLQGNLPVYLLTYMAYTKEELLDNIILTGPSLIKARPTQEQLTCEANMWPVCPDIPEEDMNYISTGWLGVGYFFVALTVLMGLVCLIWLYVYRMNSIVRASQPPFLVLLVAGALMYCITILPLGVETDYRVRIDPDTGNVLEENPKIGLVDAACMAVPWFYGVGFAMMFASLFAKIWRIKLIYKAAVRLRRTKVGYKDVMFILASIMLVELVLLITWQIIAPFRWVRIVTLESYDGYPLESVGKCDSGQGGWYFMAAQVVFHIFCLVYALMLCWQVRDIPPDFADSNFVSLAVIMMFQVSILAIPIAAMVREETDVFYFVRACALFLQSFTVLCLIFVPKMYRSIIGEDVGALVRINAKSKSGGPSTGTPGGMSRNISGLSNISTDSHRGGLNDMVGASSNRLGSSHQLSLGSSHRPTSEGGWKTSTQNLASDVEPLVKSSCCHADLKTITVCSCCEARVNPNSGLASINDLDGSDSSSSIEDIEVADGRVSNPDKEQPVSKSTTGKRPTVIEIDSSFSDRKPTTTMSATIQEQTSVENPTNGIEVPHDESSVQGKEQPADSTNNQSDRGVEEHA